MTGEKFTGEVATLKKFFEIYCSGKEHTQVKCQKKNVNFQEKDYNFEFDLCDDCFKLIEYSILKLEHCPHDIKPRCRTCPTPCYEPSQWKKVAKLMRYSGIKLGLSKVKKFFTKGK